MVSLVPDPSAIAQSEEQVSMLEKRFPDAPIREFMESARANLLSNESFLFHRSLNL
jgi:hypothetical protein